MKLFNVYKTGDGTLWLQKRKEPQDKFDGTRIAVPVLRKDEKTFRFAIDAVEQLIKDARCGA